MSLLYRHPATVCHGATDQRRVSLRILGDKMFGYPQMYHLFGRWAM